MIIHCSPSVLRALTRLPFQKMGSRSSVQFILKAHYWYREGRLSEAAATIEKGVEALELLSVPLFALYQGIDVLARTCVMLGEQEQYTEAMHSYIIRLTRVLRKMMRFSPYVASGYQLYRGLAAFLAHRPREAQRLRQKSLSAARKWHMPYDEARALYEIGRHLPVSDPGRIQNLQAAAALFEQIGANGDLELTRALLEASEP